LPIFLYTMFPFFFIFGSIMIMIKINKGWLNPFSNTIGYLIAMKLMGGAKAFQQIIELAPDSIGKPREDTSLWTNTLRKDNYKTKIYNLFEQPEPRTDSGDFDIHYNKLYKMVILKDTISEVIWYLLSGCLAISVTNNIVMNVECDYDPKTMAAIKKTADEKFKNSKKPVILQTKHY
jgi:hypothetical protein